MGKIRKVLALVIAMVVMTAMTLPALATDADNYSITVTNPTNSSISINGKQYKAYKVFDLTLGNATTTGEGENANTTYGAYSYTIKNTDWAWSTLTTGATTNDTTRVITTTYGIVLTPSASNASVYAVDGKTMTDANARALADALERVLPTTADGTATAVGETATIGLSKAGYYAVYGTAASNDPNNGDKEVVAALALTSTDPSATVTPKAGIPTLDKKITGQHVLDDAGKAAVAQIGTTVSFELDSIVPDLTGYSKYTFIISDTMSNGLTFTDDIAVKIKGADKTSECTIAVSGQSFTVTIPYATLKAAAKGDDIVVTYSAVLNDGALTTDYEKNTAKLTYSHSPYNDETNETPEKTVYVIDVDINVDKIANNNTETKLKDAKFKVFQGETEPDENAPQWYKWDATNKKVTWVAKADADEFVTGTDGKFTTNVQGLEGEKGGTKYGLLEIAAPEGYNPLDKPIIITLKTAYTSAGSTETAIVTAEGATMNNGTVNLKHEQTDAQPLATAQVNNNSGTELPSTGGMGTTIFYVIGGILVLAAAIILISKRRVQQ